MNFPKISINQVLKQKNILNYFVYTSIKLHLYFLTFVQMMYISSTYILKEERSHLEPSKLCWNHLERGETTWNEMKLANN